METIKHTPIAFALTPLSETHCREICTWTYPPPYDVYNWRPWELMLTFQEEFADPDIRTAQYHAVLNSTGQLCGFSQFFPIVGVTRLGLGMKPDLCGVGLGKSFVLAIAEEARRSNPDHEIDLEVLTWNERAIRVYRQAGFEITDTYPLRTPRGMEEFHCMVWSK